MISFPAEFFSETLGVCGLGATRVPCRCHILEFKYSNATEVTCKQLFPCLYLEVCVNCFMVLKSWGMVVSVFNCCWLSLFCLRKLEPDFQENKLCSKIEFYKGSFLEHQLQRWTKASWLIKICQQYVLYYQNFVKDLILQDTDYQFYWHDLLWHLADSARTRKCRSLYSHSNIIVILLCVSPLGKKLVPVVPIRMHSMHIQLHDTYRCPLWRRALSMARQQ